VALRQPLLERLESAEGPLTTPLADQLSPSTTSIALPIRSHGNLVGLATIGQKSSGDVYTPTDVAWLTVFADGIARELLRFDDREVLLEAQAMQQSLRRYVPGAIAEQLSTGAELSSREREVSVLFVDIRGYTGFSESRQAEEIFSTVNRYTATVSQVVQKHSGSVVEFNGDGMMTIFGAPRDLAQKERAAVEAGREIVAAVGAVFFEGAGPGEAPLSVGVGIATGPAFVGNIRAVDRMIWSAIGNTTNLAARLQSLTRDLDAAIVIDTVTRDAAGDSAADFALREDVPIRGRRQRQDVYVLGLHREAG